MNKVTAGLLLALGANAERYIMTYDNAAWNALHINSLPDNTVMVLQHLQMTVADLSADELSMYETVPGIKIEKEVEVNMYKSGVQPNPKQWGLDRIDQQSLPLDKKFAFGNEGEGVDAYIVDTGIRASHQEFENRASFDRNFTGDGVDEDCQGHGTHVASSVGGVNVGVAKKVKLHGVKVLNCRGSGTNTMVLAGMNYVVGTKVRNPNQKTVMNMSLGGSRSDAENAAVEAATRAGVTVVVAAGNETQDACYSSPASAPHAITVAASTVTDNYASFSNYGKCVQLYAPGHQILGAWHESDNQYNTISGTSMASPHVAGVAVLILQAGQAKTPLDVKNKLTATASKNKINPVQRDTPNLLLFADPKWTSQSTETQGKFSFRALNNLN